MDIFHFRNLTSVYIPVYFFWINTADTKTFMESADMNEIWKELSDGYGQSKWVAEQMCMKARSRGLPVSILRPGNMSPSSATGAWNKSDFIYMLLKVLATPLGYNACYAYFF